MTVLISSDAEEQNQDSLSCILYVTIYISFSITGLLDILIFYVRKDFLPRHTESFSIVIAFLVECLAVTKDKEEDITRPVSSCLVIAISICLINSGLKIITSSSIINFSLIMFTQIQGTWLLQSAFMNSSEKMSYLYFSWHVLAVLILHVAILLITKVRKDKHEEDSPLYTHSSDNKVTVATLVKTDKLYVSTAAQKTVKQKDELVNVVKNIGDHKIRNTKTAASDSELNSSFESVPTQSLSLADSEHCERMSPLEEFNTLHRHCEGVRQSIKMKESSIV